MVCAEGAMVGLPIIPVLSLLVFVTANRPSVGHTPRTNDMPTVVWQVLSGAAATGAVLLDGTAFSYELNAARPYFIQPVPTKRSQY